MEVLISGLPGNFPVPIAAVQHRSAESTGSLALLLQRCCPLPVVEVEDKQEIVPGVFLGPPDYHLLIEEGHFALSTSRPVRYARPSIDVLFESAADAYKEKAIAVLMTGANDDGARGIAKVKSRGGFTVVQDPATAECPVMPEAAIKCTRVDRILSLAEIAPLLVALSKGS